MLIKYGRKFAKRYDKVDLKIRNAFKNRLKLFMKDPFNALLNNHSLIGEYTGFRSINVTGDWRAIFSELVDDEGNKIVIFEMIGTHSELYR